MKQLIALAICLSLSTLAWASVEISPEVSHYSYRERNLPFGREIIDVKEDGVLYGVHGKVELGDKPYLAIEGRYLTGELDYSGSGALDNIETYLYEVRGLAGWNLGRVTLYSGYGYRYLQDDASGRVTTANTYSYLRESNYSYVPVGANIDLGKSFTAQVEGDILITGKQISHLDAIDNFFPRLENKQNRGAGFKVSVNYNKKLGNFDVSVGPYLHGWKIQNSKDDAGFYEPKNSSIEVGGKVSIKF